MALISDAADLDPRLRDEELLVEADRVAVGHAGDEVLGGDVQPLRLDGPQVQELVRALAAPSPTARRECPSALPNSAVATSFS